MDTINTNATPQGDVDVPKTQVQSSAADSKVEDKEAGNTQPKTKEAQTLSKQGEKKTEAEEQSGSPKKNDFDDDYKRRLEALEARELRADARELMKQEGLPLSCLDFVLRSDLEQTKSSIETFKQVFQEALSDALKEQLRGTTPPKGNFGNTENVDTQASIFAKALKG